MASDTRWNRSVGKRGERVSDPVRPWYAFAMELALRSIPRGGRVLELCCGAGEFAHRLRESGFLVVTVDGDDRNVKALNDAGFDAHVLDLERELPFPDGVFDAVVILEGIEHIANAEALLGEAARVLSADGLLLLSTPNHAFAQERIRHLFGAPPANEGVHLRFFTPAHLRRKLAECGFEVVARNSFSPLVGFNRLSRILAGRPPVFVRATAWEGLLAQDLVWIARKGGGSP